VLTRSDERCAAASATALQATWAHGQRPRSDGFCDVLESDGCCKLAMGGELKDLG
jgi:hypothetical protein